MRKKRVSAPAEVLEEAAVEMTSDLKQILKTMEQSLTKIDRKIDALTNRIDSMWDRLDGHPERLDQVERRVSEAEDEQKTLGAAQKEVDKLLLTLQAKAEVLEARSR
ncbi:hypothetical protein NDU88_000019 [Pleurodeles waltl]|uniref:Uncharacterized protein n=1 Tax=Pleurodeles waltl TaxID=8319 RepID=A0AAV7N946_PLEWA|nr:hypothetical protein NDU88_000019 [Pleurodeles waltl]